MTRLTALLGLAALVLVTSPALAQPKKDIDDATRKAELVSRYVQTFEMAQEARTTKTPEFLLTAALLLRRIPAAKETEFDVEREVDGKPFKEAVKKPEIPSFADDADKMLAEAKAMAKGSLNTTEAAAVETLAKRIGEQKIDAAATGGPKLFRDSVAAKGVTTLTIPYLRGAAAGIAVRSYGTAPLEVSVMQGNSLVARYTGMVVQLRWATVPSPNGGTQAFKVVIKSLGKTATPYQLLSN